MLILNEFSISKVALVTGCVQDKEANCVLPDRFHRAKIEAVEGSRNTEEVGARKDTTMSYIS